jgi:hypothetical protein
VKHAIDTDRYPLSPRLDRLTAILAKLVPPTPAAGTATAIASDHRTQPRARAAETMNRYRPANNIAACVRLTVWCRDSASVEPDPAAMAERYGSELSVPDWHHKAA